MAAVQPAGAGREDLGRAKRRDPTFTCANLFWWYAMHTSADISVTPRPMYLADGRKLPDCYAKPAEFAMN